MKRGYQGIRFKGNIEYTQSVMFTRQKLLKHQCTENVTDIVLLIVYIFIKYFFVSSYQSVGLKGNIKFPKKNITSAMECADVAAFTFAT